MIVILPESNWRQAILTFSVICVLFILGHNIVLVHFSVAGFSLHLLGPGSGMESGTSVGVTSVLGARHWPSKFLSCFGFCLADMGGYKAITSFQGVQSWPFVQIIINMQYLRVIVALASGIAVTAQTISGNMIAYLPVDSPSAKTSGEYVNISYHSLIRSRLLTNTPSS